jgi:hypothetical protein
MVGGIERASLPQMKAALTAANAPCLMHSHWDTLFQRNKPAMGCESRSSNKSGSASAFAAEVAALLVVLLVVTRSGGQAASQWHGLILGSSARPSSP